LQEPQELGVALIGDFGVDAGIVVGWHIQYNKYQTVQVMLAYVVLVLWQYQVP
jgi:hypothetical protein